MIGQTLGHYRIDSKLGEGGMGVVYGAVDIRLERRVAIKILRPDSMTDPERRRRFVQEAKAASALNHPNIVTIHEIGSAEFAEGPADFIVMEYVEGQTLDRLIGRRGLRRDQALKFAVQIADALTRAHAAGIVHRDLKPGNVMVTEQGAVKLLDFGLAKLTEALQSDAIAETRTIGSHELSRTAEGTIVGTVAYMSPEQAEGRKVDARSDIFSFGSVLYEVLTGRQAFRGETKLSVLSAILHLEPEPLRHSGELARITARCLRKDPERRYQHMGDVKMALQEADEEPAPPAVGKLPSRNVAFWSATALLLAAIGLGAGWWLGRSARLERPFVLTQLTADSGLSTDPAVSPDGKFVAYSSDRGGEGNLDIWVQQVGSGQASRLTRHPADDREPAFSPDGGKIAFRSERDGGGTWVVSTLGGDEKPIVREGRRPRFSPDGSQIAYWVGNIGGDPNVPGTSKIYVAPSGGGAPRQVQPDFAAARYPVWSPDGKRLLFWGIRESEKRDQTEDWWVASVDAGPASQTGAYATFRRSGLGLPPGSYLFAPAEWAALGERVLFSARLGDSTNLWELPLSAAALPNAGSPRRASFGSGLEMQPSAAPGGRMVFASVLDNVTLWKAPIDPLRARVTGPMERLAVNALSPMISASGKNVVFGTRRSGALELWIKDIPSGKQTSLTSIASPMGWPALSADGFTVAYTTEEGQKDSIYLVASGGGVPEKICDDCNAPWSFSSDGKQILYWATRSRAVGLLDLASRQKTEIVQRPGYALFRARFSPDNRWIAFHARSRPGRSALFVVPFRGSTPISEQEWIPVTDGESYDFSVSWSPDGNVLYFISERHGFRCVWAQRLDPQTRRPSGAPFPVVDLHSATRSMMPSTTSQLSVSVGRDKLVFNVNEISGNIWLIQ